MLPKINGFELVRELRAENRTVPVIMLSARGAEMDKVMGLELGAEDYITKPFGLAELFARVKAVLRRDRIARPPAEGLITVGALEIDPGKRQIRRDGTLVPLTATEFEILWCLVEASGRVMTPRSDPFPGMGTGAPRNGANGRQLSLAAPRQARARSLRPSVPAHGAGCGLSLQSVKRRVGGRDPITRAPSWVVSSHVLEE